MVHGDAIAGGCELALHCDLRIAAEPARLGMPLARIGLLVPFPLLQKLLEVIGPAQTRELLFTGKPVGARRALEMGMVHQVTSAAEIESSTYALARTIADNAPLSLAGIKAGLLRAISLRDQVHHADIDELARQAHQKRRCGRGPAGDAREAEARVPRRVSGAVAAPNL